MMVQDTAAAAVVAAATVHAAASQLLLQRLLLLPQQSAGAPLVLPVHAADQVRSLLWVQPASHQGSVLLVGLRSGRLRGKGRVITFPWSGILRTEECRR